MMSDDIMYDSKEDCYMVSEERLEEFEKAVAELESLKSRLPVNADGDVVLWGDEVWYTLLDGTPCGIYAKEIELTPDGSFIVPDGWRMLDVQKELHSTADTCRSAHEKGE